MSEGELPAEGLRPEARLLLALARVRLSPDQQAAIHRFIGEHRKRIDWGWFIDQAARHGLLPLAGHHLIALRLVHTDKGGTTAPYRWIYTYAYQGNRQRNLAIADEYGKVLRALRDAGLPYAIRKGPVLIDSVYGDAGLRRMGDLDLLLPPDAATGFRDLVGPLGYRQGHLSRNAEEIVDFDRRTQVIWAVHLPNSTLPLLKPAQRDDVEVYVLDPCFNLFQPRSGMAGTAAGFLDRAVETIAFGQHAWKLDPLDQILDCCVQLHVEATTVMYIELGKDLTLLKFLDLAELVRNLSDEDIKRFAERVQSYGCADSVYYALHYAQLLYPVAVDGELVGLFRPAVCDYLDMFGTLDGKPQKWPIPFLDRLFDPGRGQSLNVTSTVPGPRAVI